MLEDKRRVTLIVLALAVILAVVVVVSMASKGGVEPAVAEHFSVDSAACENQGDDPNNGEPIYGCRLIGGFSDGEKVCVQVDGSGVEDVTEFHRYAERISGEQRFACTR